MSTDVNASGAQPVRVGRGIKVLEDRILVRRDAAPEKSKGGIYLPDQSKEQPDEGTVVAVGPGKTYPNPQYDATLDEQPFFRIPMGVAVGDKVVFLPYGGTKILHEGEALIVLRESDIVAVVENRAPEIIDPEPEIDDGPVISDPGKLGDFPLPGPEEPRWA
jgi:chaperonin GroES